MSDNPTADAYRHLANRLSDADDNEIWTAFGEQMDQMARDARDEYEFVGFVMHVSTDLIGEDAKLENVIGVGYRQKADSRDALTNSPVAQNADVYVVRSPLVNNPVGVARSIVVDALESAADASE